MKLRNSVSQPDSFNLVIDKEPYRYVSDEEGLIPGVIATADVITRDCYYRFSSFFFQSLVLWFSGSSGSSGSLVLWLFWFCWFSGSSGSLVLLVLLVLWFFWFCWFSGSVFWFFGSSDSSGSLVLSGSSGSRSSRGSRGSYGPPVFSFPV